MTVKVAAIWNGPAILRLIGGAVDEAAERRAAVIRGRLRAELHRDTGEMAERSFSEVERRGSAVRIRSGSDAEHTVYHEFGTSRYPAHPQIRAIMDQEAPKLGSDIAAAVGRRAGGAIRRALGGRR